MSRPLRSDIVALIDIVLEEFEVGLTSLESRESTEGAAKLVRVNNPQTTQK